MRGGRRAGVLVGLVVWTAFLPGSVEAHRPHGHLVLGAAAIEPGPSGWVTFSISAFSGPSGTRGTVTIDRNVIQVECAQIFDGVEADPLDHFAIVGWRIGTAKYQLWIDTHTTDPTPWFQIFTVTVEGSPCDRGSLGGLAIGTGRYFLVTG